jgi:hypothetical protein
MRQIIDITQLVHWEGNLTGIPRVMNELALRYASDSKTVFVVWSSQRDAFLELDIAASLSRRGEGIFYKTTATTQGSRAVAAKTNQLKRIARKVKKYAPGLHQKVASKIASARDETAMIVEATAGDVLFILWGEWADESYRTKLVECKKAGASLVNIVYDMLPLVTPQYSGHSTEPMRAFYSEVIPLCELVFSISEFTKQDLTNWLKTQKLHVPKIETFRLGDDFTIPQADRNPSEYLKESLGKDKKYLLCVGTVEARKNHTLLYYVYKLAKSRREELPKLLIAGRRGWKTDDIFDIIKSDPEVNEKIIFLEGVTDEELSWLYRHCLFTIYPSFYEGWGLPIAESIAYDKPCISSNTSSMPEIAGNLIDYFNPASSEECLAAILQMCDGKYLAKATKKIEHYRPTTWDDTYKQVDDLMKELYEKS